ncbi:hypothetical protein [Romboutsia lituseburensis]|uniref:Uncharacterized protein n=2 Tax=Romboutsia lituseburensis TaxID=1537 RepID=A0A1G9NRC3_9FIRM|nr:hypothetical protein [Romboutsia lituseburensis]SDL88853.1 hypothetical protein SAMN04515677_10448 [Romboutsia lituseburensis DSM 797]
MNNILLILGMIALSNGNISLSDLPLFDNKNKSKAKKVSPKPKRNLQQKKPKPKIDANEKPKVKKKVKKKRETKRSDNMLGFNINDINKGMKLMELSDEDLERGMEIITRTKKYMSRDEKKILVKVESLLDLVRGIKKLSSIDDIEEEETNFFRSMEEEDKKNMMIKEILEVFPEKRKESIEKAIDMKKKIDLFAELFLPDDFGEGGFSISSLANINNLGSMNNLKLLGSLLRTEDDSEEDEYEEYDYEDDEEYEEYEDEEYNDFEDEYDYEDDENTDYIEKHDD